MPIQADLLKRDIKSRKTGQTDKQLAMTTHSEPLVSALFNHFACQIILFLGFLSFLCWFSPPPLLLPQINRTPSHLTRKGVRILPIRQFGTVRAYIMATFCAFFVSFGLLQGFLGGLFVHTNISRGKPKTVVKSWHLRRCLVNSRDYSIKCLLSFKETQIIFMLFFSLETYCAKQSCTTDLLGKNVKMNDRSLALH